MYLYFLTDATFDMLKEGKLFLETVWQPAVAKLNMKTRFNGVDDCDEADGDGDNL